MKPKVALIGALALILLSTNGPVFAHHGSAASYDLTKVITMRGTVTEFDLENPHSQLFWNVRGPDGKIVHWSGELNAPFNLIHDGWTRKSLKPGDEITIKVCPSKAGTPVGLVGKIVLANGKILQGNEVLMHNAASK
jgi:Family of unknown function (DUF6152)